MTDALQITPDIESAGNKITTRDFFRAFFKRWWLFAIVGILAGVIGIFYASRQEPQYESRLTFSLDAGSNLGGLSNAMNLAAQFGLGFGG